MNRKFNSRSLVRGFTLIEVMVAMVIVAVSLSAVLASVSKQLHDATAITERTYASWIAQNKIAEIRLTNVLPEVSSNDEEVQYAGLEWLLKTTISATDVENLFRIDVEVSFLDQEGVIRSVSGFVGEPSIPGQANSVWSGVSRN